MKLHTYLTEQSHRGRWSGSVLVSQRGNLVVDASYSLANRETGQPNTPQTIFQIASISKQFAAAAILLLRDQGRVSVRDRIAPWIADCPPAWETITIHQVLTHTSGLPHWFDLPDVSAYAPTTREHLLHAFAAHPLKFAPGTGWAYSSPGYVLLAHIVEQITGEPYAEFLRRSIFAPLGLTSTSAGQVAREPARQAAGYAKGKPEPSMDLATVNIGAGDIWSTTHDLARWDAALSTPGLLLSAASLDAMFSSYAAVPDDFVDLPGTTYGYGWALTSVNGHALRLHPGDNAGFIAVNIQIPEQQALIILLSNDEDSDLTTIALHLLHALA